MNDFQTVARGVRRLTAPNPGPMTYRGTNTYLLGETDVAVVDPGPQSADHLARILNAVGQGRVSHILVTHAHVDHSAGVAALVAATGAPVHAFGAATAGRSAAMQALADSHDIAGGEGLDQGFAPDHLLADGDTLASEGWRVEALHTPGHLSSHLSFALPDLGAILTGDTVMGWSTTLISPPDGSVSAFLASLERLRARDEQLYLPGHGDVVADGGRLAAEQMQHRRARETQIVAGLQDGAATPAALTARIYAEVPATLHRAAMRNVIAHLIDLAEQGRVRLPESDLSGGSYALI